MTSKVSISLTSPRALLQRTSFMIQMQTLKISLIVLTLPKMEKTSQKMKRTRNLPSQVRTVCSSMMSRMRRIHLSNYLRDQTNNLFLQISQRNIFRKQKMICESCMKDMSNLCEKWMKITNLSSKRLKNTTQNSFKSGRRQPKVKLCNTGKPLKLWSRKRM